MLKNNNNQYTRRQEQLEQLEQLDNDFCSNLTEFSDICKISNCIESVNGLPSTSASNTDAWVVNFKNGVKYDSSQIEKGFIKLWLSRTCVEYKLTNVFDRNCQNITGKNNLIKKHLEEIDSLNYEAKVYRDIIKDLVDSNICPNFIRFLGLGQNCSFSNVSGMLESTLGTYNNNIAFYRNVLFLIRFEGKGKKVKRPSTTDIDSILEYVNNTDNTYKKLYDDNFAPLKTIIDNSTFTVLLNEAIKDNTEPWFEHARYLFDENDQPRPDVWKLLFQLMAAIYAMSLSGLNHNDLHLNNSWVEPCEEKDVSYVYGGQTFNFKTSYVVKVFDFDRSYNKRLKNNDILDTYCSSSSQCNKYIPNIDAMKVIGDLYIGFDKRPNCQQILLNICASNPTSLILLQKTWGNGHYLVNPGTKIGLTTKDYKGFSSVFHILQKIALLGDINSSPNNATIEDTYICHEDMFDENGKIKPTNVSHKIKLEQLNSNLENLNNELVSDQTELNNSNSQLQIEKGEINKLNNILNTKLYEIEEKQKQALRRERIQKRAQAQKRVRTQAQTQVRTQAGKDDINIENFDDL